MTAIRCQDLTKKLDLPQCTKLPIAGGGLGDIYKGRLDNGTVVAIKCARPHTIATDMDHMQVRTQMLVCVSTHIKVACAEHSARDIYLVEMQA